MRAKRRKPVGLALEPEAKGEARAPEPKGPKPAWRVPDERREARQPLNPSNRPDPYARWCGRGGAARLPPIPIAATL